MTEKTAQKEPGKKPVPSKKPKPQQEVVVQISLSELHPFPDHPFQVREDASIQYVVNGVTANSLVFTLKKLCDALDITLSEFFDCPEFNDMDEEIE